MSWDTSGSAIFAAFIHDSIDNTADFTLADGALKVALFDDTITPLKDADSLAAAYGAGVWLTGAEVIDADGGATEWDSGGRQLSGVTWAKSAGGLNTLDADDTASGTNTTLTDVFGALVYDSTLVTPVASQGICFNAFGGGQSVTQGTFTVVYAASGVLRLTV